MKKVITVLLSLLIVSLVFNGIFAYKIYNRDDGSLIGTFIYMPNNDKKDVDENVYLIFDENQNYLFYKQGNICIDNGSYKIKGKVISLKSKDGSTKSIIFDSDRVFCSYGKNTVIFLRHSDVPAYVNNKHE